jgi:hypothetical protein
MDVHRGIADGLRSQEYPSWKLAADLAKTEPLIAAYVERAALTTSLAQFYFSMERPNVIDDFGLGVLIDDPGRTVEIAGYKVTGLDLPAAGTWQDLAIYLQEGDGVIHGMLYFNGDIFDDASAERLLAGFKKGLRDGLAAPNGYLGTESRARDARGESIEAGSTVVDLLR